MDLLDNTLSSSIPTQFGLLKKLRRLNMSNNTFIGGITLELGLLPELSVLYLNKNTLTGSIPSSLCGFNVDIFIDCGEIACTCCRCDASDHNVGRRLYGFQKENMDTH